MLVHNVSNALVEKMDAADESDEAYACFYGCIWTADNFVRSIELLRIIIRIMKNLLVIRKIKRNSLKTHYKECETTAGNFTFNKEITHYPYN